MRTFRAKFSGGGTLVVTYLYNLSPHTWEATGVPESLQERDVYCGPWSLQGLLESEAELAGETVEIEDDEGPVDQIIR